MGAAARPAAGVGAGPGLPRGEDSGTAPGAVPRGRGVRVGGGNAPGTGGGCGSAGARDCTGVAIWFLLN